MTQSRVRQVKRVAERTVEEIQKEIAAAASRLGTLAGELALAPVLKELERDHFPPEPAELERMGTGEQCPSVAFEAHGDLAGAIEALGEALDDLRRAAGLTSEAVQDEWRKRRLKEVADDAPGVPAIRSVSVIQADILRLAARTARLRADHLELLAELDRDHLTRGPAYDAMVEDDTAPSLAYYLAGVLGVVESDQLREVEADLLEAAEMTAAVLERQFDQSGERARKERRT